jgi:pimeloyl-ACP methyl ester carboxylesterase
MGLGKSSQMHIIERGNGCPLVFIPGLQGRWEYQRRAIEALAGVCRVMTFSLCDEPSAGYPFNPARGLDAYVDQVEAALDARGIPRATICGLSFGGLIALRFAARYPNRTSALVLVSVPGPGWHLKPRHARYVSRPWLFAPFFFAGVPARVQPELMSALPRRLERSRFKWEQLATFFRAPLLPSRMAARARLIESAVGAVDVAGVAMPTLVVTGEPGLDHVVPADGTAEYARIPEARLVRLERTGHLGCITRPGAFAALVKTFLDRPRHAAA